MYLVRCNLRTLFSMYGHGIGLGTVDGEFWYRDVEPPISAGGGFVICGT